MVGKANIGSVQTSPAPSAAVLNEALKLLATFGDKKGLSDLMTKASEVQKANEEVLAQIRAGLEELHREQSVLDTDKMEFQKDVRRQHDELQSWSTVLKNRETDLIVRETKAKQDESALISRNAEKQKELSDREKNVILRESLAAAKENELSRREASVSQAEAKYADRVRVLEERESKLRAFLSA
jgi:uncharacterized protein (DUF3084 family)